MTIDELLTRLEEAEAKASPAPWKACHAWSLGPPASKLPREDGMSVSGLDDRSSYEDYFLLGPDDAELIALSRNSLKKLIDVIRVQQEGLEFYADTNSWGAEMNVGTPDEPDVEWINSVLEDEGNIANEVLSSVNKIASGPL